MSSEKSYSVGWGSLRGMPMRRSVSALVTALAIGALSASHVGPPAAAAGAQGRDAADQVDASIPAVEWEACKDGLRCATVRVPLDYDDPTGPTTKLALAKRPATDPGSRVGTVFVNPGGPGDSAVGSVPWYSENLPRSVRERFDVVGIDPRGVGGSSALRCEPARGETVERPPWEFPLTGRQTAKTLRYNEHVRRSCSSGANPVIDHMTTADTARDMDLIRQALGDEKLTYYGISYGSYLGATYAAMFPDRIRAMVVDGVVDPVAYATGHDPADAKDPVTTRWRSGEGSWETLTAAFAECDRVGKQRCPIAGESTSKWRRVMNRLERGPVEIDGERLRYQDVVSTAAGALSGVQSYVTLMQYIGTTYDAMFGNPKGRRTADAEAAHGRLQRQLAGPDPAGAGNAPADLAPMTEGVICLDSRNPSDPRAWIGAGERNDRRAPRFGKLWTWRSSTCAQWPGSSADAYRGPFQTDTSAPVLVIGTRHDPATPISGARALNSLLDGSRMLTLDGWGHGALGESSCVGSRVGGYLLDADLPPSGTVCDQDDEPFPQHHQEPRP